MARVETDIPKETWTAVGTGAAIMTISAVTPNVNRGRLFLNTTQSLVAPNPPMRINRSELELQINQSNAVDTVYAWAEEDGWSVIYDTL